MDANTINTIKSLVAAGYKAEVAKLKRENQLCKSQFQELGQKIDGLEQRINAECANPVVKGNLRAQLHTLRENCRSQTGFGRSYYY